VINEERVLRADLKVIFYALNHPFFFFKGQLPLDEYLNLARRLFPAFEVRNGTMLAVHNELAEAIVRRWSASSPSPLTAIGGSDSHTLRGIGTTYTEAPGSTRDEFLQSLRAGRARACGRHGSTWREARDLRSFDAVRMFAARRGGTPQAGRSAARERLSTRVGVAVTEPRP
jgi:hypothetical protein